MKLFANNKEKRNDTAYWDGKSDTFKNWDRRKRDLGEKWYFYDKGEKEISYIRNEIGFRERSVYQITWSKSIVIFGCSVVEGIGNKLEDTIAKKLEKKLDIPVLNFGVSGTSIDLACINSLILHNYYPRPKAIIHLWTGIDRYVDFRDEKNVTNYLPNHEDYYFDYNWAERNKYYVEADRTLWKNKTIYLEGSTFSHTAKTLNVKLYDEYDKGRDLDHPGPKTNEAIADNLVKRLKNEGL